MKKIMLLVFSLLLLITGCAQNNKPVPTEPPIVPTSPIETVVSDDVFTNYDMETLYWRDDTELYNLDDGWRLAFMDTFSGIEGQYQMDFYFDENQNKIPLFFSFMSTHPFDEANPNNIDDIIAIAKKYYDRLMTVYDAQILLCAYQNADTGEYTENLTISTYEAFETEVLKCIESQSVDCDIVHFRCMGSDGNRYLLQIMNLKGGIGFAIQRQYQ